MEKGERCPGSAWPTVNWFKFEIHRNIIFLKIGRYLYSWEKDKGLSVRNLNKVSKNIEARLSERLNTIQAYVAGDKYMEHFNGINPGGAWRAIDDFRSPED